MISHGTKIKIFTGNAHPRLAKELAEQLGLPVSKSTVSKFSDGEIAISIGETVRGCDVFVVQPTCYPVNDNLMELLIMIDAFKRASAGRITAVIPYFGYARQDRKAKARDPISARHRFRVSSTFPLIIFWEHPYCPPSLLRRLVQELMSS